MLHNALFCAVAAPLFARVVGWRKIAAVRSLAAKPALCKMAAAWLRVSPRSCARVEAYRFGQVLAARLQA
jgi:hypothetical protein